MQQIIALGLTYRYGEQEDTLHPVVLRDDCNMILVDCGYPGFLPLIEQAMEEAGLRCEELTAVFITHHDHDHMGALGALKGKYPRIQVIAGENEAPYIAGEKKALRLEQAEASLAVLPEDEQAAARSFCEALRSVEPCPVDVTVRGGDRFDWCGGCEILDTPGHTAGHQSLFLYQHRTVVAGDAAIAENGSLTVANPQYAYDLPAAERSLEQLLAYDADTYICYHGGVHAITTLKQEETK